jgi:hypothetical protein
MEAKNISVLDTAKDALERLRVEPGTPMSVMLLGAGLITQAAQNGTLKAKLFTKKATTERHLFRNAFSIWDRIRTGEHNPWQCSLCARDYSGLQMLSVLAMIEQARGDPVPSKPAVMALVCQSCDSVSTQETQRRIEKKFGFYSVQQGTA